MDINAFRQSLILYIEQVDTGSYPTRLKLKQVQQLDLANTVLNLGQIVGFAVVIYAVRKECLAAFQQVTVGQRSFDFLEGIEYRCAISADGGLLISVGDVDLRFQRSSRLQGCHDTCAQAGDGRIHCAADAAGQVQAESRQLGQPGLLRKVES